MKVVLQDPSHSFLLLILFIQSLGLWKGSRSWWDWVENIMTAFFFPQWPLRSYVWAQGFITGASIPKKQVRLTFSLSSCCEDPQPLRGRPRALWWVYASFLCPRIQGCDLPGCPGVQALIAKSNLRENVQWSTYPWLSDNSCSIKGNPDGSSLYPEWNCIILISDDPCLAQEFLPPKLGICSGSHRGNSASW